MSHVATPQELSVPELASKNYLRAEQRNQLEDSIRRTESMLANAERSVDVAPEDLESLAKQLGREKEMLEAGTPPEYDLNSKRKIYQIKNDLEARFTHVIPTFTQMERARPDDQDFHIAWERTHQQDVLAWKTCLLILDPHNTEPNFLSVSRLRSDTVKGDPRAFRLGFDNMDWNQEVEADLSATLDDASFYQFLALKSADWAEATICKQLGWSKDLYAVAMRRWRESLPVLPLEANGTHVETIEVPDEFVTGSEEEATPALAAASEPEAPRYPHYPWIPNKFGIGRLAEGLGMITVVAGQKIRHGKLTPAEEQRLKEYVQTWRPPEPVMPPLPEPGRRGRKRTEPTTVG